MNNSQLADLIGVAVAQMHDLLGWHRIDRLRHPRLLTEPVAPGSPAEAQNAAELDKFAHSVIDAKKAVNETGRLICPELERIGFDTTPLRKLLHHAAGMVAGCNPETAFPMWLDVKISLEQLADRLRVPQAGPLSTLDLPNIVEAVEKLYRTIETPPTDDWQAPAWVTALNFRGTLAQELARKPPPHYWLIRAAVQHVAQALKVKTLCPDQWPNEVASSPLDHRHKVALVKLCDLMADTFDRSWLKVDAGKSLKDLETLRTVLADLKDAGPSAKPGDAQAGDPTKAPEKKRANKPPPDTPRTARGKPQDLDVLNFLVFWGRQIPEGVALPATPPTDTPIDRHALSLLQHARAGTMTAVEEAEKILVPLLSLSDELDAVTQKMKVIVNTACRSALGFHVEATPPTRTPRTLDQVSKQEQPSESEAEVMEMHPEAALLCRWESIKIIDGKFPPRWTEFRQMCESWHVPVCGHNDVLADIEIGWLDVLGSVGDEKQLLMYLHRAHGIAPSDAKKLPLTELRTVLLNVSRGSREVSWEAVAEETDRFLPDDDRVTPGTGTNIPPAPESLPILQAGVPLYDVTVAWIRQNWGSESRMPGDGLRFWNLLLGSSRGRFGNTDEKLRQWARWLASQRQAQPTTSGRPAMCEFEGARPSAKRFRVAFSFAGERRDFVAKVAETLAKKFGKNAVLYDKYHEAEFARSDLGIYLPNLYHDESDLIVVVLCPDYQSKEWCGLEWTAIHAMLKNRKNDEVMLCRFEHASVTGLYDTAGFIDLDRKTPKQAAEFIIQRLAANGTKLGKTKP
jgi:hypothetical protein